MGHELLWKIRRVLFSRLVQDVVLLSAASPSIYCLFAKSTLIHGTLPSEPWCSLDPWGLLGWWHWLKAGPPASWKTRGGIKFFNDSSFFLHVFAASRPWRLHDLHEHLLPECVVKGSRLWVAVELCLLTVGVAFTCVLRSPRVWQGYRTNSVPFGSLQKVC